MSFSFSYNNLPHILTAAVCSTLSLVCEVGKTFTTFKMDDLHIYTVGARYDITSTQSNYNPEKNCTTRRL